MYLTQLWKPWPSIYIIIYPYGRLVIDWVSSISREYQKYQLSVNWIRSRNQLTNTDFSSPSLRNENIALVERMSQKRDEIYM